MKEIQKCPDCKYRGDALEDPCDKCKQNIYYKFELCEHHAKFSEIKTRRCEKCQAEIDEDFDNFWRPLVSTDGELDFEKIKGELHDFHFVMQEVRAVYMHITNGNLSKPNYNADVVISEYERQVEKQIKEALEEEREQLQEKEVKVFQFCRNCRKTTGITGDFQCSVCGEHICVRCGCTDSAACPEICDWAKPGVCTSCEDK